MAQTDEPVGKNIYYMHFSVETQYSSKANREGNNIDIKTFKTSDRTFYESDYMSMYADDKNAFLVVNKQKQIVWGNGGENPMKEHNLKLASALQDSLIRNSRVISCNDVAHLSEKVKEIILIPNEVIREKFKIKKMVLLFNDKTNRLIMVTNYFTENEVIERQTTTYHTIDFNYTGEIAGSAFEKIFYKNGKLKSEYMGYELTDNRVKK